MGLLGYRMIAIKLVRLKELRRQRARKNMCNIFNGMYDVVYDLFFHHTVIGLITLIMVSFSSNIRNAENSCAFYFFVS